MPAANLDQQMPLHVLDAYTNGKAIVLLHGLGSNGSSWTLQVPQLVQKGYRVLAPDLPGFGMSPALKDRVSIKNLAHDIAFWLEKKIGSSVALIGLSLGGAVALQIALDYPCSVCSLGLVSTFARFEPSSARTWSYLLRRFLVLQFSGIEAQAEIVARHIFPDKKDENYRRELRSQIIASDLKTYRAIMVDLAKFDVLNRLSSVICPTLVVSGSQDQTVPLKAQYRLSAGIKNAKHVVIPEAGHAVPIQIPDQFNSVLFQFLLETYPCA